MIQTVGWGRLIGERDYILRSFKLPFFAAGGAATGTGGAATATGKFKNQKFNKTFAKQSSSFPPSI